MKRMRSAGVLALVGSVIVSTSSVALAQGAPPTTGVPASGTPTPAPATTAPKPDEKPAVQSADEQKLEEARQRYQRGLQLYNENNFEAARVEFERAYQLAPSYRILYNIGLCYEQLGDYVQAQTILKKYIELGFTELSAERAAEVNKELAQIRPRIARATLRFNTTGVEVLVDDICATDRASAMQNCGVTALNSREILMNPGRRRITARKAGFLPETQVVTVAGSDELEVKIDLKPIPSLVEKKTNPYTLPMWIGWGLTAAGGITAIIAGVTTNGNADDQAAAVGRFGVTRAEIDEAKDKTETSAMVTDGALIATGVFALASGYFTYRALTWKGESSELNVKVGGNSVGLGGRF